LSIPPAAGRSKPEVTILLIEHDIEAVFALADRTVLVYGRVIASGAPAAILENAEVRKAHLGEQATNACDLR
jgi:branched-chain amino acid transport system ATP-binding protein